MIIYSLQDAAKYLGCSKKTIQRMVERKEMPQPMREEKDAAGKIWRLWDSSQLDTIKAKVLRRQRYNPKLAKEEVSNEVDLF